MPEPLDIIALCPVPGFVGERQGRFKMLESSSEILPGEFICCLVQRQARVQLPQRELMSLKTDSFWSRLTC